MLVIDLQNCKKFIAGDQTILRELIHADKSNLNLRYSLAHATLSPGKASKPHKMKISEVYYILQGEGVMHINEEVSNVKPHQAIYIPPNTTQYIENTGSVDLEFLCIVDPAWKKEDEIVL